MVEGAAVAGRGGTSCSIWQASSRVGARTRMEGGARMVGLKPPTVERDEERRGGGLCVCGGGGRCLGFVEAGGKRAEGNREFCRC